MVGPDLGQNCLQRLSADSTSRQRALTCSIAVKHAFTSRMENTVGPGQTALSEASCS